MARTAEQRQHIREWVAALRSGEFQQGYGWLRRQPIHGDPFYCCLGVACELYRRENPGTTWENIEGGLGWGYKALDGTTCFWDLPPIVSMYYGVPHTHSLMVLNDVSLLSFSDIADAIEREYLAGA